MSLSKSIAVCWAASVLVGAALIACSAPSAANPPNAAEAQTARAATQAAVTNSVRDAAMATRTAVTNDAIAARGATSTVLAVAAAATSTSLTVMRTAAAESAAATQTAQTQAREAAAFATGTVVAAANANAAATRTGIALAATQTAMPTPTAVLPVAVALATPNPGAPPDATLLTDFRTTLLLLRRYPELATDKALLDAVTQQVTIEQSAWKTVDCYPHLSMLDPECHNSLHPPAGGLSPKRSTFFFEWQKALDNQPEFARGPLLNTFSDPQADWSFFKREQDWDDSFDNLAQVFLFSRESIQDRQPAFVSRDLVPVYRQLLSAAAANQPSHYWFRANLPAGQYDFASSTYRFANNSASPNLDLLGPPDNQPGLPDETKGRANYGLNGAVTGEQDTGRGAYWNDGSPNGLRLRVQVPRVTAAWQQGLTNLLQVSAVVMANISLDHQLQLPPIQVEPALAEKLSKRAPQFEARVYINVDHAWTYDRKLGGTNTQKQAGLSAQIERVDVVALMQPLPGAAANSSGSLDEQLLATLS